MKMFTKEWYRLGCPDCDEISADGYIDNDIINLHDCQIIAAGFKGNQISIDLDNSGSSSLIEKIIIEDYTVLQSCEMLNSWCVAEELYELPDKNFEFHLLLQNFPEDKDDELDYFTVKCKKITFIANDFKEHYE